MQMAHIFLTSKGFFTESVKEDFLQLVDGRIAALKAAIITTASSKKEKNPFAVKTKEDFLEMGLMTVDFLDVEFEDARNLLAYDVFYICGGNPFRLLRELKESGAERAIEELVERDTIFIGVSAGAMIFGPHIEIVNCFTPSMNTVNLKDLKGLGIFPKPIFPHYGREDKFPDSTGKTVEQRIAEFEAAHNLQVERLTDSDVLLIER